MRAIGDAAEAAPILLQYATWLLRDAATLEQFQVAASALVEAVAAHERRGDLATAAHAAVIASHAFFAAKRHDEATIQAQRSVAFSETVWRGAASVEDRAEAGELWAAANAQLLWCLSKQFLPAEEAWKLADRSKPPELSARIEQLPWTSSTLDFASAGFRAKARTLTAQRWRIQRERVTPDSSLATAIEALQERTADLDEMQTLVGRQRRTVDAHARVNELLRAHPTIMLADFSVSESGTVALIADSAGTQVRCVPMTRRMLAMASSLWHSAYRNRRNEPTDWPRALEGFLRFLGEELLRPAVGHVPKERLAQSTLVFIPGILFGKPLHAAPIDGVPLCDGVLDFAYAATVRGLSLQIRAPRRSLCILSDNESPPNQLQFPPREIAEITASLAAAGVLVTLLAQRAAEVGSRVFSAAAVQLDDRVTVLDERPTPERILALLSEADHVFYTGHAVGGADHGLVLSDEIGREVLLSTLDLFGEANILGKKIVLSACETAREPFLASAEPMSIAAALLQLGAGFLLGSSWVAIDRVARDLCTAFHRNLVSNGWDPVRAFSTALRQLRASSTPLLSEWATFLPFVGVDS